MSLLKNGSKSRRLMTSHSATALGGKSSSSRRGKRIPFKLVVDQQREEGLENRTAAKVPPRTTQISRRQSNEELRRDSHVYKLMKTQSSMRKRQAGAGANAAEIGSSSNLAALTIYNATPGKSISAHKTQRKNKSRGSRQRSCSGRYRPVTSDKKIKRQQFDHRNISAERGNEGSTAVASSIDQNLVNNNDFEQSLSVAQR